MPRTSRDIFLHYGVGPIAKEARHVAEAFYAAAAQGEFDDALTLFEDAAFLDRNRESRAAALAQYMGRMGALKSREIASRSEVQKRDGDHYGLEYRATYESHASREKFALMRKKGEEEIRILEFSVKCKELSLDGPP